MFAAAVCRVLRESRRRQKLTQAEVAQRTGGLVSKAALANYETGHRSLRVDVLWVIAGALGEDLGTLLTAAERSVMLRPIGGGEQGSQILAESPGNHPQHIHPERPVTGFVVGQRSLADQSAGALGHFGLGQLLPAPGFTQHSAHSSGKHLL